MEGCFHRHLDIDTDEGRYACAECGEDLTREEALALLAGRPLLRVVPEPPEEHER